jgi:hypothetical protein
MYRYEPVHTILPDPVQVYRIPDVILSYSSISCQCSFVLISILKYPHLIQPFYPFISCYLYLFILTFILLVIRSCSLLIRLVVACCLIGPSFAYPAQQQSKPLCFYFPTPRCGSSQLPLLVAPAQGSRRSGTCSRCCQRRCRISAAAAASAGAGRGEGSGGGEGG